MSLDAADRRQDRGQSHSIWLTIFSDMSTNLMLFFLMLFSLSRMNDVDRAMIIQGMTHEFSDQKTRDAVRRQIEEQKRREQVAIENLRDVVHGGSLKGNAYLEESDRSLKLTLSPQMFFDSGSAEINPSARAGLESLVQALSAFSGDIVIEGHTDNVPVRGGRYTSNWELSVARAVSVIEFLGDRGLDRSRMVAGGYGEFHPAFPNDTAENRARNRRIEITILKGMPDHVVSVR